jgi:hypothetical protein
MPLCWSHCFCVWLPRNAPAGAYRLSKCPNVRAACFEQSVIRCQNSAVTCPGGHQCAARARVSPPYPTPPPYPSHPNLRLCFRMCLPPFVRRRPPYPARLCNCAILFLKCDGDMPYNSSLRTWVRPGAACTADGHSQARPIQLRYLSQPSAVRALTDPLSASRAPQPPPRSRPGTLPPTRAAC